jgi:hypothetical protein
MSRWERVARVWQSLPHVISNDRMIQIMWLPYGLG